MSKALDYKTLSEELSFEFEGAGEYRDSTLRARITADGSLRMHAPHENMYERSGYKPEAALALGRWLVDMYEDKDAPTS